MAIRPQHVFPLRCASGIEERWLHHQDEGSLGMMAATDFVLRCGNFFKRASKMDGDGSTAISGTPRNRLRKCIVDLERTRGTRESLDCAFVTPSELVTRDGEQRAWRGIEQC